MKRNLAHMILSGISLAACTSPPTTHSYDERIAPPQVVYRIDHHRHFEIVPRLNYACVRANLYYVDKSRGIRAHIPGWDRMETNAELLIDAANDQYLVAPIADMDSACAPDAHPAHCASFLVYSQDSGRTWQITKQLRYRQYNGGVRLVGDTVYYAGHQARLPDLVIGDSAWHPITEPAKLPPLNMAPIDSELHCDNSKTIPSEYD